MAQGVNVTAPNTYDDLFQLVNSQIDKRLGFDKISKRNEFLSRDAISPAAIGDGSRTVDAGLSDLISAIQTLLKDVITSTIISGLQVTAQDPPSAKVEVARGRGAVSGRIYELDFEKTLDIALDGPAVQYVVLYFDHLEVIPNETAEKLTLAKIVIPQPGVTSQIVDKHVEGSIDAYIVNFRKVTLYEDGFGHLEEDSLDFFRNNIGDILADNLIGNIRLSENLKVTNSAGTLELNSNSMKFFDIDGSLLSNFTTDGIFFFDPVTQVELAHFTTVDARIGNIVITQRTIQSGNYVPNVSGFVIEDDGDAEFNNIRLRGTLFTSTIAENLYINPGIRIIGDLNLSESDLWVDAGHKIGYDYDAGQDTYGTYNAATGYFEIWVDGSLRVEL